MKFKANNGSGFLAGTLGLAVFLLAAPMALGQEGSRDAIVAIVNHSVITYEELQQATADVIDLLRRQYADQPKVFQDKLNQALKEQIENLVDRKLILQDFKKKGYVLPESYVDDEVRRRIQNQFGDRVTLIKTLQAQGLTFEDFRKKIRNQIIIDAMQAKHVSSEIIISPYKIKAYYAAHTNDFKVKQQVKLRMIYISNSSDRPAKETHELMREIRDKIMQGVSFATMATIYSEGSQRSEGGQWPWVDRSVLRQALVKTAFSLKPGQVSQVIDVSDGCYLLKVEAVRPPHIKPLKEVQEQIDKTLRAQTQDQLRQKWISRLKAKAFIRYF